MRKKPNKSRSIEWWEQREWSKPSGELAEKYDYCRQTVTKWRKIVAPETLHKRPLRALWVLKADWHEKDKVLASKFGVSRQAIHQMRRRYGEPRKRK